jgi:preprotein translocase subunit YajC
MFASPAFAQTAGAAAGSDATAQIVGLAPLFLVFIAFYFLMIRPQQKRMKALQAAVNAVKKGDEVTTAGGIIGKVTKVDERVAEVEIAQGVRVRVVKATLASVAATGGAKPAND